MIRHPHVPKLPISDRLARLWRGLAALYSPARRCGGLCRSVEEEISAMQTATALRTLACDAAESKKRAGPGALS